MNSNNKIGTLFCNKRDWLILLANLFLFMVFPFSGSTQNNPFIIKKDTVVKDTIQKVIEYIVIRQDSTKEAHLVTSPVMSARMADSLLKKKDSLFKPHDFLPASLMHLPQTANDSTVQKAFFYPHSLQAKNLQEMNKRKDINDWAFVILVAGFLLFAGVQFSYHKRMLQIFKAFGAARFLNQLMRGSDFYKERITYNLYLIFLLVFPLFLFEINQFYQLYPLPRRPFTEILFYLELFFLNLLVYSIKVLALRSVGSIFKTREITSEYLMTHFIFSLVQGLVVLVFIAIVVFTHSVFALQLGIVILILMYFFQLFRGFFIGLRNTGYSMLYLILFFLTIEVLPVLILVKLLSNTMLT